jgi:hypothetical protein
MSTTTEATTASETVTQCRDVEGFATRTVVCNNSDMAELSAAVDSISGWPEEWKKRAKRILRKNLLATRKDWEGADKATLPLGLVASLNTCEQTRMRPRAGAVCYTSAILHFLF